MRKQNKRLLILLIPAMCLFLTACKDDMPTESDNNPSIQNNNTQNTSDASDTSDDSSTAIPDDILPDQLHIAEYYTLYTEYKTNSIQLAIPEGFELLEFSDETDLFFAKSFDKHTLNFHFVLWKQDVSETETSMINEVKQTIRMNFTSEYNIEPVHTMMIGDLEAQGFQNSYTTRINSTQEFRIWIPYDDETTLVCITNWGGHNYPDYTEETAIGLLQLILSE